MSRKAPLIFFASVLVPWLLAACGATPGGQQPSPDAGAPAVDAAPRPDSARALTYYRDVKPIIDRRCAFCHSKGNIGPFTLTSYAEVKAVKAAIARAVRSKIMPPWLADATCNSYKRDISLTAGETSTLLAWLDGGMAAGDPKDDRSTPAKPISLKRVDAVLRMPESYTQTRKPDHYRCFVLDWPYKDTRYITGFQVKPDNKSVVHHVITYLAYPKQVAAYQRKDKRAKGLGYDCYGGPGVGSIFTTPWLGVWAPGGDAVEFPAGTGVEVPAGSKVIFQVHYNADTSGPGADRSAIEFTVEKSVKRKARIQPYTNPLWLSGQNMFIPKGKTGVTHSFAFDPTVIFKFIGLKQGPITMHAVMLHMHELGAKGGLSIERKGGKKDCLLNIPRYDFGWQRLYSFAAPKVINPGDLLRLTCVYDNTPARQPLIQGKRPAPKDTWWGLGTRDEMCLGVLYIELP